MSLEAATFINQLNPANPTATDPKSQGDDHLRLTKQVLQNTWPNVTGAVTGTQAQLNYVASTLTNWGTNGNIALIAGVLGWKKNGNAHVIFDASAGTAPNGSAVSDTNSVAPWSPGLPTLMGWNGASTFGIRVDSARDAYNGFATTWVSLTGSRALGVTYTNTTPRAIFVAVTVLAQAGTDFNFLVNSFQTTFESVGATQRYITVNGVVPAGMTYIMGATGTINSWVELR